MKNWQKCEEECLKYLQINYSKKGYDFEAEGGSDSTKSDILLKKYGMVTFYIESKMSQAQCGQFVAFPDPKSRTFDYSRANAYPINIHSELILEKMAEDFDRYKNPGTDGIELLMDNGLFYSWIGEFYKEKNVKYFIIEKDVGNNNMSSNNFVIFPIEHFQHYFNVSAKYRRKKSGSSNPTENDYSEITKAAKSEGFSITDFYSNDGKHLLVQMNAAPGTYKIIGENHTFQFKNTSGNEFIVTRLSNTNNPNVIFSIGLIQDQQQRDLDKFELEFN
ncbi:MAG: hypothetical protein K6F69_02800 [Treponema sp.]|nr:hypothetical protein [Treponema sp.]